MTDVIIKLLQVLLHIRKATSPFWTMRAFDQGLVVVIFSGTSFAGWNSDIAENKNRATGYISELQINPNAISAYSQQWMEEPAVHSRVGICNG